MLGSNSNLSQESLKIQDNQQIQTPFDLEQKNEFLVDNCQHYTQKTRDIVCRFLEHYPKLISYNNSVKQIIADYPIQLTESFQLNDTTQIQKMDNEELNKYFNEQYSMRSNIFEKKEIVKSEYLKIKKYSNSVYYGEQVNKLRHGRGILYNFNGTVFEGEFQSDFKYGKGYEVLKKDGCYYGDYVNGFPEGLGILRWRQKEFYIGEWFGGKKNGIGKWISSKGDIYIGQWFQGSIEGQGIHLWINEEIYFGEIKNNLKHGIGHECFANDDEFQGEYANGKPNGKGLYKWHHGGIYDGQFINGLRHGLGSWKRKNTISTDQYEGEYSNDKKCGKGVYTWDNGAKYTGEFYNDKRNGFGEIQWNDGAQYKGLWQDGLLNGLGEFQFENTSYKGQWKQNQLIKQKANQKSVTRISLNNFPKVHHIITETVRYQTQSKQFIKDSELNYQESFYLSMQVENSRILPQQFEDSTREQLTPQAPEQQYLFNKRKGRYAKSQNRQFGQQEKRIQKEQIEGRVSESLDESLKQNQLKFPQILDKSVQTIQLRDMNTQTKIIEISEPQINDPSIKKKSQSTSTRGRVEKINEGNYVVPQYFSSRQVQSLSPFKNKIVPETDRKQGVNYLTKQEIKLWNIRIKKLRLNPQRYDNLWKSDVINKIRNYLYPKVWKPTIKNNYKF